MTEQEKELNEDMVWRLNTKLLIPKNEQRSYNGGYLFLQKIYHELGLDYVRNRQISRAQALLDSGRGNTSKRKSPNDAKRYIKFEYCTADGELAQIENFSLNQDMIDQESCFDGFYGICTDLEGSAPEIIKINGGRWIIENGFRTMKTDLTNNLHGSAGFRTDYQIVTKKQMRSIIAQTKKRDKDNED